MDPERVGWSEVLQREAAQAGPGTEQADAWVAMQGAVQDQALGDDVTREALSEAGLIGSLGLERHDDKLAGYEAVVLAARDEDTLVAALDTVPRSERRAVQTGNVSTHLMTLRLYDAPRVAARLRANTLYAEVTADVQAFASRSQLGRARVALLRLETPQERSGWMESSQGKALMADRTVATLVTATLCDTGDKAGTALLKLGWANNDRALVLDGLEQLTPASRAALRAAALDKSTADGPTIERLNWLIFSGLELTEPDVVSRLAAGASLTPMAPSSSQAGEDQSADFTKEANYLSAAVGRLAGRRDAEWVHATDLFSRAGERVIQSVLVFAVAYRQATQDDGQVSQAEYLVLKYYADEALEAGTRYEGVRSALSATASTIAATAAAAVVIGLSGGTATPAVMAAATACGGLAAGTTDYALRGQADAEWAENVATGTVDAAFTALGAALSAGVLAQAEAGAEAAAILASVEQAAPRVSTQLLATVLDGALGGAAGEAFRAGLDPATWNAGVEHALGALLAAAGRGAIEGAAGAAVGFGVAKGLERFAGVLRTARPHHKAIEFAKALRDALPADIREDMLAAAEVHVLDEVDGVDEFFKRTGSRSGTATIWTDGERIIVYARPGASAKDIAEEAAHLEQLFSASRGSAVRELYDAVPDVAAWRAMGDAGQHAEQLRLYKSKITLELEAQEGIRATRQAAGDVEGVREAEETLDGLRRAQARAEAVTAEELASGRVPMLDEEPPWLFAKRGRREEGPLRRYDGPKPTYMVNNQHVPGRGLRKEKTPLPPDAEAVYAKAVPNSPDDPTAWFGQSASGSIYRYSVGNDGTAHFSGISDVGVGTRNMSDYARKRLQQIDTE